MKDVTQLAHEDQIAAAKAEAAGRLNARLMRALDEDPVSGEEFLTPDALGRAVAMLENRLSSSERVTLIRLRKGQWEIRPTREALSNKQVPCVGHGDSALDAVRELLEVLDGRANTIRAYAERQAAERRAEILAA